MVKKPATKQLTKKAAAKKATAKKPSAKVAAKGSSKPSAAAKNKSASAKAPTNGTGNSNAKSQAAGKAKKLSPEAQEQIGKLRSLLHENFGKVAIAMMVLPRYRNQSVADLQHMLLEPMTHDRIAIATSKATADSSFSEPAGIAIWASVSKEVDTKIREQIKTGSFPIRLKEDEWTSGDINWLLDVIAPSQAVAASLLGNFKQVTKGGELNIHPIVSKLVNLESLKKTAKAEQ